ncbi:TIGR04255 family protein [Pandoraea sp. XY-2]|uniref:TIGR04255 family protein n=1 Tax=Pandoraea sp. XY-2 TaxID=2518599 RepID=UPI00101AF385|nr:TIGR04255 family protein [Pandoraea sp. XY-2]QBC30771.1 hypothetical protein DRB87_04520 [Pandoraea sp. XY-2]
MIQIAHPKLTEDTVTKVWSSDSLVDARSANVDRYERTFLRQAVCEFRFPTLLELGGTRPPATFVAALRKEYPHLELTQELALGHGSEQTVTVNKHVFRSEKLNWTVSLKESAFSIETNSYTTFPVMRERILRVLSAATKIIDSEFFTRVGLRYINMIDANADPVNEGWINHDLVAPLHAKVFTGISEYAGRLNLATDDGGCLLQHGLKFKSHPARALEDTEVDALPMYLIDIDAFRNGVALEDSAAALDSMHAQAFDVFDWAIGDAARSYLATPKRSKAEVPR